MAIEQPILTNQSANDSNVIHLVSLSDQEPSITLETRYGRLRLPAERDDLICTMLERYGEWAWLEARFVASVLEDGARVLDGGSYAGTFGLGVAQSRRLGFLCCVEANPAMARLLSGNLAANMTTPSCAMEALIAGPASRDYAGRSQPGNRGAMSFDAASAAPGDMRPAEVTTLAALREEHGPFDAVKLDIEGMELEALLGDAGVLSRGHTTIWVECNEARGSLDVARVLLSWGLELHYFAFPAFNPGNVNGVRETMLPWAYEAGLLAAPRTTPVLTPELLRCGCILRPINSVEALRDALWRTPRWGVSSWEPATTPAELAALVGRSLREETFDLFLRPEAPGAEAPPTIWQRMQTVEAALEATRTALRDESTARHQADHGRLDAEARMEHLAAELASAQARCDEFIARIRESEQVAAERLTAQNEERAARRSAETISAERLAAAEAAQLRTAALEDALTRAEADSAESLASLDASRLRVGQAERELGQMAARARANAAAAGTSEDHAREVQAKLAATLATSAAQAAEVERAAQERIAAAEAELRQAQDVTRKRIVAAESQAAAAERAVKVMQDSTLWRVMAPARAFVHSRPTLRRVFGKLRRARTGS